MAQQESRVKKSLLNARVNLIFYFLTLALSFFSRKIFLDTLGADFVGLTGTLQNLLGFLNLAELGIGSAIGYVLYKPLFDHDETKINEIISIFGYIYRWIGMIILGAGLIMACFLPLIFPHTKFEMGIIFFAYFSFLVSSLLGYFINYKQTLLGADQKNYVVTAYFQSANIIKTIVQMASAYYTGSYYMWVTIEIVFGIVYSFILNWKINQTYPWLKTEVGLGKQLLKKYPEVAKYTKQLFVHKISGFVQNQTAPFLIYTFVSLKIVAYYGNYTIIIDKLSILLSNFLDSTNAGVGNLIAEGSQEKIKNVFWELISLRFLAAGTLIFSVYHLLPSFISLWIGKEYLLSETVLILILINLFIGTTRGTVDQFLFGYGLFYDIWAPITESVIYLTVAIIGGHFWGLEGVLFGATTSRFLIVGIWKPYFLFTKGFKISVWQYWKNWLFHLMIITATAIIIIKILSYAQMDFTYTSWHSWLLHGTILSIAYISITLISLLLLTKGTRNFISRIIKI